MKHLPMLTLTGNPRERGRQHGKALKDGIYRFYKTYMERSQSEPLLKLTEADLLALSGKHGPYIRQYAPDLYEEMEGIAEGAEMALDKVLFINCFDEILDTLMLSELAAKLTGQPLPPTTLPLGGCTTFAAFGEATIDGKIYIGQGYDVGTDYEPVIFRIEARGDEPEQLIFSHAGVVGTSGINAAGLAITVTSLKLPDQQPGVPMPIMVRKTLQQTILSDFIGAIIMAHRASGHNYTIGAPYAAVNIETSATKYDFKYLHDGIFGHANHYESPQLKPLDLWPNLYQSTLVRSGRMYQLLKARFGKLDLEALKEVLRDHANYPNSICRHEDPRGGAYSTISALIYRPEDRLMLATNGTPCANQFQEFTIPGA
jgi:isopenicillin-N N-acyltransferase-like protein